jgi:aminoglycoside N3'-acetyltransferase
MGLAVHSSLRSFVRTAEGPKTVVEALMETLTAEGTLLFPSFNLGTAFGPDGEGYYDPRTSQCTVGAIPDFAWRQQGFARNLNPTHPFAAWGKKAKAYLKDHHRTMTMGRESPLGRLWRDGGYCLLIGVDYRPNTFKHVVEAVNSAPCLGVRTEAYPVRLPNGREVAGRTWGWRERGCPLPNSEYVPARLARDGLETRGMVGPSPCILFKLDDFFRIHSELLANGVDGLPPCRECPIRPRVSPFNVVSDWDLEAGHLMPDSVAWTYDDGL